MSDEVNFESFYYFILEYLMLVYQKVIRLFEDINKLAEKLSELVFTSRAIMDRKKYIFVEKENKND